MTTPVVSANETVMLAIQSQLEQALTPVYGELQVDWNRNLNPTPPAIDIYPADPFQEQTAYGYANAELFFTIRARVSTIDHDGGQQLLLGLLDRDGPGSLIAALAADRTLQGWVADSVVDYVSGFAIHQDVSDAPSLLGVTWRLKVEL